MAVLLVQFSSRFSLRHKVVDWMIITGARIRFLMEQLLKARHSCLLFLTVDKTHVTDHHCTGTIDKNAALREHVLLVTFARVTYSNRTAKK